MEILSALKAALKRNTAIKLVFYQFLLLFQTVKSAFEGIVTGQLQLEKVLLKQVMFKLFLPFICRLVKNPVEGDFF